MKKDGILIGVFFFVHLAFAQKTDLYVENIAYREKDDKVFIQLCHQNRYASFDRNPFSNLLILRGKQKRILWAADIAHFSQGLRTQIAFEISGGTSIAFLDYHMISACLRGGFDQIFYQRDYITEHPLAEENLPDAQILPRLGYAMTYAYKENIRAGFSFAYIQQDWEYEAYLSWQSSKVRKSYFRADVFAYKKYDGFSAIDLMVHTFLYKGNLDIMLGFSEFKKGVIGISCNPFFSSNYPFFISYACSFPISDSFSNISGITHQIKLSYLIIHKK